MNRREFDAYARRNRTIDAGARRAFDALWTSLGVEDVASSQEALARYMTPLADRLGKVSALNAAEFYDSCRASGKARGAYEAVTAQGRLWHVERDIAYAASAEFAYEDPAAFLRMCLESTVRDYGRETILFNADRDPQCTGYMSMPTGDDPCAFCIIKALGTYWNYQGRRLTEEISDDAWHANCTCELTPIFDDIPDWASERMDEYGEMYSAGRADAEKETGHKTLTANEVVNGMRRANGIDTHGGRRNQGDDA